MPLGQLVIREIKAMIKNPAFIASLMFIFFFYGFIGGVTRAGISQAVQETTRLDVGVVTEENNQFVELLINRLNASLGGGIKVYSSIDLALNKSSYVIVLPRGFTDNATVGRPAMIWGYAKINDFSQISIQAKTGILQTIASILSKTITQALSILNNISIPQERPVIINQNIVAFGKVLSTQQINSYIQVVTALIFILSFMMGLTTSSATSITAIEKVEKAFEMLLSQPIPRRDIVIAKIIGSVVMAFVTGFIYFLAMFFMIAQISQPIASEPNLFATSFNLTIFTSDFIVFVIISLIIGLIYSGAIGVLIGSISSDERTAGVLAMPITLLYFGFGIATLFISIPLNITTSILYGVLVAPMIYVLAIAKLSNAIQLVVISLTSSIITCIVIIAVATHIFNSDIVITGIRLSFTQRKRSNTY
ncbi:MAG: ABC transporter permease [Ignisphaera sp.]